MTTWSFRPRCKPRTIKVSKSNSPKRHSIISSVLRTATLGPQTKSSQRYRVFLFCLNRVLSDHSFHSFQETVARQSLARSQASARTGLVLAVPGRELEPGSPHTLLPTKTRANPCGFSLLCQHHSYLVRLNLANPIQWHNAAFRTKLFPLGTAITQNHELALWSGTELILNQKQ